MQPTYSNVTEPDDGSLSSTGDKKPYRKVVRKQPKQNNVSTEQSNKPHRKVVRKQPKQTVVSTEKSNPKPRRKSLQDKNFYDLPNISRTSSQFQDLLNELEEESQNENNSDNAEHKAKSNCLSLMMFKRMKCMHIFLIVLLSFVVIGIAVAIAMFYRTFLYLLCYVRIRVLMLNVYVLLRQSNVLHHA